MRKFLVPVAVALVLGTSGLAMAASTTAIATKPAAAAMAAPQAVTNTIKSVDMKTHTLVLANGISYKLPSNFKDPGLKAGQKVTVKWQMNGKAYDATSVVLG
ncbi:hypothetical protein ABIB57_001494 [Devosia sp. UYZn731]|uniref:DUF1344 domain-containing protein n=1 Tax=Devosia sp. UYZn731 TaxID=3156345 RepID=UPI003399E6AC